MDGEQSAYAYEGDTPELLSSFVCYADILGYKQESRTAILDGREADFLGHLRRVLNAAYERVRSAQTGWAPRRMFEMKVFTDNIVVRYPIRDPWGGGEPELGHIMAVFIELQIGLAMEGKFVRGGIAVGHHYMDDEIVFGEAFLEAVALDHSGGPPCLALTPSAVELVRHHLGFYADAGSAPHNEDLLQDADGTVFLNYLSAAFDVFPEAGVLFDVIEKHRRHVIENLARFRGNPGVRSKYEWAARYHNFVCRDFAKKPYPAEAEDAYNEATQRLRELLIGEELMLVEPRRLDLEPISRFAR